MTQSEIGCNILRAMDSLHELQLLQDLLEIVFETSNTNSGKYYEGLDMVVKVYNFSAVSFLNQMETHLNRALRQKVRIQTKQKLLA